jgi:alpha-1,2-mannosyltransferase
MAAAPATVARVRIVSAAVAVLSAAVFCLAFRPWHWYMGDLLVYRAGGSALLHGRDIYAVVTGRSALHFTYPPFAAAALSWLAPLPLPVAKAALTAFTLVALVLVLRVAVRRSAVSIALPRRFGWLAIGLFVWLEPVRATLSFGQIDALLMALVVLDLLSREHRFTGVGTGLAAAIKLTPLALIPYLIVTDRRRPALVAAASFAGCALIGFLVDPADSRTYWGDHYFTQAHRIGRIENASNQSILGIAARALGTAAVPPWWLAIAAVTFLAGLGAARRLHRQDRALWSLTAVALAMLTVSPISWSHHWIWCVLMAVVVLEVWICSKSWAVRSAAISTLLPFAAAMIFWPPHAHEAEFTDTWWQQLLSASYVVAAVALVAILLVAATRVSGRLHEGT